MSGGTTDPEITRLKAEVEELREIAEKHRLLIETTDTGFVILDGAGRVADANAEYVKLTGHERLDQIAGRPVTDWTAPGDRERNAAEVRRCLEAGAVRNLEIDYLGPDGRRRPIEINATVRRTRSGATILTVCRDISERRRVEEALRNSEQRYRATIDSMGEAIHVVDQELRIELLNGPGEEWFRGIGIAGEIVGRRIFEVFPFLPQSVRDEYGRVFAGGGPLVTEELNTVDGREVATETRKIPIVEGGRVVRVVTAIRDVTDSVRARETLRQTEKLEALGQLAGGIAHDFNNQLSAVMGYSELLARGLEEPRFRDYAIAIAQIASRSADLTRQLLTFARKGRGRSVPVEIHGLLGEVAAMLGRTIDPRIAIRMRLDAARATTIGDPAQLQSAFLNLAINARDAMPNGGELTFATDLVPADAAPADGIPDGVDAGARLRVRVTDTGVGMTEEIRRRAFEPFFTTKGPGHGTGMGLAAVYGAVTNHRGEIRVDSEPGRGSTFAVLLPLAETANDRRSSAPREAPPRGRGHVLLVDDEPAVLDATAKSLAALGYRVTARTDGAAAVACYREAWRKIDVVLLDVMMPELGGIEALARMRLINPTVRAILYSGHPLGRDDQRLVDDGVAAFLEKPFTMAELGRLVASLSRREG